MKHLYLIILFCCANYNAKAEYFKITNYHVQMEVSKDGYFDIEETIDVYFFEKRHGIIWNIPHNYVYEGEKRSLSFTNITVKGYQFKESYDNGFLNVRIGSSNKWVNGNQRYILNYRVYNAFTNKEAYQKLHWNLVGTGWDVPIEKISYTIILPDSPKLSETDYKVYTYKDQSISKGVLKYNWDGYLTGKTNRALIQKEGLQIEIKLPKGYIVSIPISKSSKSTFLQIVDGIHENLNLFLFLLLSTLGLALLFLFKPKKKSIEPRSIVKEIYPPVNLTPAEAGFLIDDSADYRDIIALLPYWGRAGLIKIVKTEYGDYQLVKLKDITRVVQKYELNLFDRIFKHSDAPLLIDLQDKFYPHMVYVDRQLVKHIKKSKLYQRDSFFLYSFFTATAPFLFFFRNRNSYFTYHF